MQAFEGIRVLDFTHVLAGPFCSYQLAVMGADVIKIESPSRPDMMRPEGVPGELSEAATGTQFLSQGGNKRSLAIDLTTAVGRAVVIEMASTADVVVENFRCGVMDALGLGYNELSELNTALVYCSMTGFGHTGPKARHPAYDNVIQAFSGLMAQTGSNQTAPVRVGPPVLDYGTGAQAAFAIAAALFQRSRDGCGQHIDVAMLDAALMLMSTSVVDTQQSGQAPVPPGNSSPVRAGYGCYETASGLLMLGAFTVTQNELVWRLLEEPQLAAEIASGDHKKLAERLESDRQLLAKHLLRRNADEWETLFNDAGVPAAKVRDLSETLQQPQLASRSVLQGAGFAAPDGTELKAPVAAFGYAHDGPQLKRPAPRLGQHSRDVLGQWGYSAAAIDEMIEGGVVREAAD